MDDKLRQLLEKRKMEEIQKMEDYALVDRANIAAQDEGLDITKRLAKGKELARQKEIEDMAKAREFEEQSLADEETKRKEEYEKKLKEIRFAEYNKEIEEKGYANKSDYPDLFPEEELNPMKMQEEQKKRFGYK